MKNVLHISLFSLEMGDGSLEKSTYAKINYYHSVLEKKNLLSLRKVVMVKSWQAPC